jgi:hypothetical protein
VTSLSSCENSRQDLWSQTKITRERSQQYKRGIVQICQPSQIFSDFKHLTLNLNINPIDAQLFFLDAYFSPIFVTKWKIEGNSKIVKGTPELQGTAYVESVIYNSEVNQWERFLEPASEKVVPVKISFMIGQIDMTQVVDNMEEIPIVAEGL